MAFRYETVVPWGRSFEEYVSMFSLSDEDLDKTILGCGDGPACFNAVMNQRGKKVISIDPIYQFTAEEIQKRIDETYLTVINQTRDNQDKFIWTTIKSVEDLGRIRMLAMETFLLDYDKGKNEKRYIYAELPILPFKDKQFELALSSHFLFLYTDNLSLDFHFKSIDETLRVAKEVRIFPLLDINANRSPYVNQIIKRYQDLGYSVEELEVNYQFQKGGNKMLKIFNNTCKDLNEVRENIDRIDHEIVRLIAERSCYVRQAANFKKDSEDVKAPERIEKIIEKVRRLARGENLNPDIIEVVYRNMINAFINLELEEHGQINK